MVLQPSCGEKSSRHGIEAPQGQAIFYNSHTTGFCLRAFKHISRRAFGLDNVASCSLQGLMCLGERSSLCSVWVLWALPGPVALLIAPMAIALPLYITENIGGALA